MRRSESEPEMKVSPARALATLREDVRRAEFASGIRVVRGKISLLDELQRDEIDYMQTNARELGHSETALAWLFALEGVRGFSPEETFVLGGKAELAERYRVSTIVLHHTNQDLRTRRNDEVITHVASFVFDGHDLGSNHVDRSMIDTLNPRIGARKTLEVHRKRSAFREYALLLRK